MPKFNKEMYGHPNAVWTQRPDGNTFLCISVKTSLLNTKLGNFMNVGVLFLCGSIGTNPIITDSYLVNHGLKTGNRPLSIYQYSYMAPRLSGQTFIFGVVFFVSKSLLGIEGQEKLENLQFWPESLGAMLEYWYIKRGLLAYRLPVLVASRSDKLAFGWSTYNRNQCLFIPSMTKYSRIWLVYPYTLWFTLYYHKFDS